MSTVTRRLVNAKVAYRATSPSGREYITTTGGGAWGVPEQALAVADNRPDATGIVITDVHTGEQWFVPKTPPTDDDDDERVTCEVCGDLADCRCYPAGGPDDGRMHVCDPCVDAARTDP